MSYYGSPIETEIERIVQWWERQVRWAYVWGFCLGWALGICVGVWLA